jgi:hypothetical protein
MLQAKVAMNILGRIVWRKGTVFMDLWKGMRFTPNARVERTARWARAMERSR